MIEHNIYDPVVETRPVEDQFYGDRSGGIEDPFGHHWHISTHTEDLTPEEIEERMKNQGGGDPA